MITLIDYPNSSGYWVYDTKYGNGMFIGDLENYNTCRFDITTTFLTIEKYLVGIANSNRMKYLPENARLYPNFSPENYPELFI